MTTNMISWWFDVVSNTTINAANFQAIKDHVGVFSRVHPCNENLLLDGNLTEWWGDSEFINSWNEPLQAFDSVKILPYLVDIDNSTMMHMVMENSTAFIKDAVAIAKEYSFDGWFIDYEDEYPPDSDPNSGNFAAFLSELGDALHDEGMELTVCVAAWTPLLSNYKTLAGSSVDELQQMSTYAMSNPADYEPFITDYFSKVGDLDKAGVGIGVYYDGGEYEQEWDENSARSFIQYVSKNGGTRLDIFRLLKDGAADWPKADWWWDVLEEFVHENID
mmetsp:Transcript_14644/g.27069  ORF Transcript_14644/g.27069 Transcript_14644/m.27069 type:complete len:276 (+) Transcript_14644:104-931(+)